MSVKELLKITTSEKKSGFLLIEIFSKLFNPHKYGHQVWILGGHFFQDRVLIHLSKSEYPSPM